MSKKASRPPRKKRANGPAKAQDRAPAPLLAPASQVEPIPLPRTDPVPSLHVDAPPPLRSEPQALESVRTLIRDEIGRQHAIEKSRRPLQMIAEASIRLTEDVLGPGYVIVDEKGTPRTKVEGGGAVPFTIVDLVAELRLEHPNLFQDGSGPGTKLKPPPLQPDPDLVGSTPRPGDQTAPAERTAGLSSEQREPEAGPAPSALMPAQIPLIAPAPTLATRAAPRPAEVTSIRRLPRSPADRTVGPQRRASLLPPAWMPSRTARLRLLYVLAFLGGLAAYGAVRHFA